MSRKAFSAVMIFLLVLGTLALASNVQPVKSDYAWTQTIYIMADGSIQPSTAPIFSVDNVTYTLTDNIAGNVTASSSAIIIERDNIIIDGAGHTLQGTRVSNSRGIELTGRSNVTIKNMEITAFDYGIQLRSSSNNSISGNNITANVYMGIYLYSSSNNNSANGNSVTATNYYGIFLYSSSNNKLSGNNITANNGTGIYVGSSPNNSISGNNITNNGYGIWLDSCSNNSIDENNITNNQYGISFASASSSNTIIENNLKSNAQYNLYLDNSSANHFYLNSFVTSTGQIYMYLSANSWDNGYPSGGNYWSTHAGAAIDLFRGVGQNESGSDGIGDAPYIFGSNETDHYPLMGPFGPSTMTGSNVTVFPASDFGLIFSNVTAAGDVVLNKTLSVLAPPLGNLTGEYYDVKVTASVSGNITIRIIYDASNMTFQQESSLQMMQYTPIPGDIRPAFGKVDMADIGYIARRFGTNSSSPLWDPAADITGPTPGVPDGKIDMRDIGLVARNFGRTSQWLNITTYVDTTNNVIYGETTHFSLIAIH